MVLAAAHAAACCWDLCCWAVRTWSRAARLLASLRTAKASLMTWKATVADGCEHLSGCTCKHSLRNAFLISASVASTATPSDLYGSARVRRISLTAADSDVEDVAGAGAEAATGAHAGGGSWAAAGCSPAEGGAVPTEELFAMASRQRWIRSDLSMHPEMSRPALAMSSFKPRTERRSTSMSPSILWARQ